MRARILSKFSSLRGWLTEPHQILSLLDGSSTTNLSLGERPVYWPVLTTRGPSAPSIPSPLRIACSTRRALVRLCLDSSILMSRLVSAVDAISCIYKPPCLSCSLAGGMSCLLGCSFALLALVRPGSGTHWLL